MPVTAKLLAAYLCAEYAVHEPAIVIRVGERNSALDELIGDAGSAAFVTAANPGSERQSDEENARRTEILRQALATRWPYAAGEGGGPEGTWEPEPSFLVLGISRIEAADLAREFGQNAFVWCESAKAPELVIVDKWRFVLDTNVWLDWLAFDDPSVVPLKEAMAQGRLEIYLDAAAEAELARALAYPLRKRVPEASLQEARLVEARRLSRRPSRDVTDAERTALPRCSDQDDQKFLELAAAVQAHALVTKDRALLELAKRAPFRIVPPSAAARLLDGPDQG
jgi:putative PIN family toxin of toxin-antitoxin system